MSTVEYVLQTSTAGFTIISAANLGPPGPPGGRGPSATPGTEISDPVIDEDGNLAYTYVTHWGIGSDGIPYWSDDPNEIPEVEQAYWDPGTNSVVLGRPSIDTQDVVPLSDAIPTITGPTPGDPGFGTAAAREGHSHELGPHASTHEAGGSDPIDISTYDLGYVSDDDPRLSDTRIPRTHASTHASGGSDPIDLTGLGLLQVNQNLLDLQNAAQARTNLGLGNAATRNVGTTSGTVVDGADSRLSDTRTPTAGSVTNASVAAGAAIDKTKLAALNIVNADVANNAAIAKSKLGALAIGDSDIASSGLTNAAISSTAAIAKTKLASLQIGDSDIASGGLTNAALATAAGIVSTKLSSAVQTSLGLADGSFQKSTLTTAGDIAVATGPGTVVRKGVGATNGLLLRINTAVADKLEYAYLILPPDTFANRPTASDVLPGTIFPASDTGEWFRSNGSTWSLMISDAVSDRLLPNGEMTTMRNGGFSTNQVGANSQTMKLTYFTARRSETISQVRVFVGAVAASASPTLARIAVWEAGNDGALTSQVAITANDTALFTGSTNSARTKSFSASFTKTRGKRYAVGLLVVTGGTAPQFLGSSYQGLSDISGLDQRSGGQMASQPSVPTTALAGAVQDTTSVIHFELLQ